MPDFKIAAREMRFVVENGQNKNTYFFYIH